MGVPYAPIPGPASTRTQLEVGTCTDSGREPSKQVNEDAALARETAHGHLAVVCDGMGGHVGGREASQLAVETIFRTFDEAPPGLAPQELLAHAIRVANHAVFTKGQTTPELAKMGSTCVAVLTHAGGSEVAHVGDSRVYLITQGQAYQVTKDHSLVQRLVDANMLTPEQASNHPNANQITNALGMRSEVDVEVRPQPFPPAPGDTFLLCSDGLSDELGPADFLKILAPHPPIDLAARQLVDLANARGGHDNITVVLVRLPGGGPFAPPASSPDARLQTPIATPPSFPVPGGVAPTATLEMVAQPPPATPIAPAFVPPPVYPSAPIAADGARKGKLGLLVAIVVLLVLLAGGIFAALRLRSASSEPSTSPSSSDTEPSDSAAPAPTKKKPKPKPTAAATDTDTPSESPSESPSAPPRPRTTGGHAMPTTTLEPTTKSTDLAPEPTAKLGAPTSGADLSRPDDHPKTMK